MKLSLKCKMYGDQAHTPCSGTTDDGTGSTCECRCHASPRVGDPGVAEQWLTCPRCGGQQFTMEPKDYGIEFACWTCPTYIGARIRVV